jgi:hypothetical protein
MPHTLDRTRLQEVFDAIEADEGFHLTSWEIDFFGSVRDQRNSGRPLSDKQLEIIERIYLKV